MFTIGICDDDERYRTELVGLCDDYIKSNNLECEIIQFSSGEEVLAYEGDKICLLLLDVEMGKIDGIEVMRRLEKSSMVWRIVFVTSHEECVWDSFGLKTLGFAVKPLDYNKLQKWISIAVRENNERVPIEFDTIDGHMYKYVDEICYIKASGNYSILYDGNSETLVNGIIKAWQDKLKDTAVHRIHKSYLVNFEYIKKLHSDKVVMQDGTELNVGRLYREKTNSLYKEFVYELAMGRR